MSDQQQRNDERVPAVISSYVRRPLPEGGFALMQFVSKDLSLGGIFVVTDNLSTFDLGEVVTLIIDRDRSRYFEGSAKVVRSTRVFSKESEMTESGYGLMFAEAPEEFHAAIAEEIASASA